MLELVDSFHLGWNGISTVQVQVLLSIQRTKFARTENQPNLWLVYARKRS